MKSDHMATQESKIKSQLRSIVQSRIYATFVTRQSCSSEANIKCFHCMKGLFFSVLKSENRTLSVLVLRQQMIRIFWKLY